MPRPRAASEYHGYKKILYHFLVCKRFCSIRLEDPPLICLVSILYHSETSEVPYLTNKKLVSRALFLEARYSDWVLLPT
jgi:hypothetical protein